MPRRTIKVSAKQAKKLVDLARELVTLSKTRSRNPRHPKPVLSLNQFAKERELTPQYCRLLRHAYEQFGGRRLKRYVLDFGSTKTLERT